MPHYKLRTLLIVLALGPLVLAQLLFILPEIQSAEFRPDEFLFAIVIRFLGIAFMALLLVALFRVVEQLPDRTKS